MPTPPLERVDDELYGFWRDSYWQTANGLLGREVIGRRSRWASFARATETQSIANVRKTLENKVFPNIGEKVDTGVRGVGNGAK
jgi:hypothetical protein